MLAPIATSSFCFKFRFCVLIAIVLVLSRCDRVSNVSPKVSAAAGVDSDQRVKRAEADCARGEHDPGEREERDSADRRCADEDRSDDRHRRDHKCAKAAIELAYVPGHVLGCHLYLLLLLVCSRL